MRMLIVLLSSASIYFAVLGPNVLLISSFSHTISIG